MAEQEIVAQPGTLIVGNTGSGKSITMLEMYILPAFKLNRRVVTNVPINIEEISKYLKIDLDILKSLHVPVTFEDCTKKNFFPMEECAVWGEPIVQKGDLLVIDEFTQIYRAPATVPSMWINFLEHHRKINNGKFACQLVVATQFWIELPKNIREKFHLMLHNTQLIVVGQPNRFRVDFYNDSTQNPTSSRSKPYSSEFHPYNKEMFPLYSSGSLSAANGVSSMATASQVDERFDVNKSQVKFLGMTFRLDQLRKYAKYAAGAGALLTILVIYWLYKTLMPAASGTAKKPDTPTAAASASAPAGTQAQTVPVSAQTAPPPQPELFPGESTKYRLVGFYRFNNVEFAVISDSSNVYHYLTGSYTKVIAGPATHITLNNQIIAPWTGNQKQVKSNEQSGSLF